MKARVPCVVVVALLAMGVVPLSLPAAAGPDSTVAVYQVSGTPSPPANGDSPFADCDTSGFYLPGETDYVNSEIEAAVAVNPTDSSNIIGAYRQDTFSFGRARGLVAGVSHDGGQTWSATFPSFSICAGGNVTNGGDFQRASDVSVSFSPNGTAYFSSTTVNFVGTADTAVRVSTSPDGGDHWSEPVTLVRDLSDVAPFYNHGRSWITADPLDSNYVYVTWQRSRKPGLAHSPSAEHTFAFRSDTMFARSTDGGQTWEDPRAIVRYRDNSGTFFNQLEVLPDGTLVVVFDNLQGAGCDLSGGTSKGCDIKAIRSTDRGDTWSDPIEVAPERAIPAVDPDTGRPIQVAIGRPDTAVDLNPSSPGYGNIYATWADRVGSPKKTPYSTVVFTESTDGGLTWSPLARVNQSPVGVDAFTPAVAVASDGTVAITYYDFRYNTPDPGVPTDFWMIQCQAGSDCAQPSMWAETHVAGSFDFERAPVVSRLTLGSYTGLTSDGTTFLPFFNQTTESDQANTYLGVVTP
jgi:hypothetical protein